jgi:4-amino-4-deoxy-L-arabinose transferase-like glycosyltransferase
MNAAREPARPSPKARGVLFPLLMATVLVHLPAMGGYGWFRDELYYVSCAKRLAWGYVDQPPLSIALLAAWRLVVGDSLEGMRVVPLLAHVAVVWLTMRLARRLGGGGFAEALAGVGALGSLVFLGVSHVYSMNALDLVLWLLAAIALLRALEGRDRVIDWVWFGAAVGAGLLNKLSMLWCAGGLALGVLVSVRRRVLATPGPWLAGAIAAAMFAPHFLWQMAHGWPTLEFMHNATANKMIAASLPGFLVGQLLAMNPLAAPIWLAGLVRGLRGRSSHEGVVLAVQYLAVLALLVVVRTARADYLSPAYPGLLALGGVAFERATSAPGRRAWRAVAVALPLAGMLALVPFALPVLPVGTFIRYQAALGRKPDAVEHHRMGALPQHYADMFGWPELADSVARVAATLTPDERRRAIVIADNYGEAGALEMFGRGRLPRIAGQHNNWYLWGPPAWDRSVAIFIGRDSSEVAEECDTVLVAGSAGHPLAMPYERDLPIVIARHFRPDLAAAWRQGKHYE